MRKVLQIKLEQKTGKGEVLPGGGLTEKVTTEQRLNKVPACRTKCI